MVAYVVEFHEELREELGVFPLNISPVGARNIVTIEEDAARKGFISCRYKCIEEHRTTNGWR